jgi:hypothetical protein
MMTAYCPPEDIAEGALGLGFAGTALACTGVAGEGEIKVPVPTAGWVAGFGWDMLVGETVCVIWAGVVMFGTELSFPSGLHAAKAITSNPAAAALKLKIIRMASSC